MTSLSKPFLLEVAQQVRDKVESANASSSALQPSAAESVVQTSPRTPSAKPRTEKTCLVTIDRLAEEDVEMSHAARSPTKQSVKPAAATDAVSEKTKTVANVSQSPSRARQSTSTSNVESSVEISDESDTDYLDTDELSDNYWLPSSKWAKRRGTKRPWSDEEEELVYKGVKEHGVGNWAVIRSKFLQYRSNVDIKDKWRTMKRQGRLEELARQFGPLN